LVSAPACLSASPAAHAFAVLEGAAACILTAVVSQAMPNSSQGFVTTAALRQCNPGATAKSQAIAGLSP